LYGLATEQVSFIFHLLAPITDKVVEISMGGEKVKEILISRDSSNTKSLNYKVVEDDEQMESLATSIVKEQHKVVLRNEIPGVIIGIIWIIIMIIMIIRYHVLVAGTTVIAASTPAWMVIILIVGIVELVVSLLLLMWKRSK